LLLAEDFALLPWLPAAFTGFLSITTSYNVGRSLMYPNSFFLFYHPQQHWYQHIRDKERALE
jgi:hypothetical protein